PTPGTISTCMFYTELDPYTMEPVFVAKTPHDKALQRALLQYFAPNNQRLVIEALQKAGRTDLIGTADKCLIRPQNSNYRNNKSQQNRMDKGRNTGGKKYKR
ncbi:MAG: DUF3362 domain-containing protein, partial [Oscillospiraceae bacterium]